MNVMMILNCAIVRFTGTAIVPVLSFCPGVPEDFLKSLFRHGSYISVLIRLVVIYQATFRLKNKNIYIARGFFLGT